MRGVSGFDRPAVQWTFVAVGIGLIAVAVWAGVALRRGQRTIQAMRAEVLQAQVDRDQIDAALQRERATREALRLQLGRERTAVEDLATPTLTLSPVARPSPNGPELTVPPTSAPVVDLRLLLPPHAPQGTFTVRLRSWTGGDVLWLRAGLRQGTADNRPAVIAPLATDVFVPGTYEIRLTTGGATPTDVAVYEVAIAAAARAGR
ncbi:MAG TPA: hypothetical protein VFX12_13610 [Vicinamibacterales bacterium]|nr:hypothetical protein [Vicinamibacterales bacterium]